MYQIHQEHAFRMLLDTISDIFSCIFRVFAVCSAPKRRFKPYEPAVVKNANDVDVRKARKAQIKRDEAFG